ncbi:hypothetical protein [Lacisediminimonas profundi]|uniref:hypothetical protein n=1 Tax=Lacisediminimonas profundi TaxID=2603856 RepID=UPI001386B925|nr:hypothetical protein [Lacisediminimonas profundi]
MGARVRARLREPSTWAGLAVLVAGGAKLIAPEWAVYFDMAAMILGGGAVVKAERTF